MKKLTTILITTSFLVSACGEAKNPHRVVGELASDRIELTAESNEPITAIRFAEGDSVAAGQVLIEQDNTRAAARLAEAEGALAQMQARLDELVRGPRAERIAAARASVEGATQELDFRESEIARTRELHARGLASPDSLDRAQVALDTAQSNLKLRLAQLEELLSGTTVEELEQAEQAVKQAAAQRDGAKVSLDRHVIQSPVSGIAESRLFELGERPTPGQPLVIVLGGEQPYARVYVPERLRVHVAAGDKATVFVDGLDTPVQGRVRWVASEAAFTPYYALTERDRGRLSYVAKIDFDNGDRRLPDGVPVEVEFAIN